MLFPCLSYKCHPRHRDKQRCPFPALFGAYKETAKATAMGLFLNSPQPGPLFANSWRVSNRSGSITGPNRQERCKFGTARHDRIYHAVKRGWLQSLGKPSALGCRPAKKKFALVGSAEHASTQIRREIRKKIKITAKNQLARLYSLLSSKQAHQGKNF